MEKKLLDFIKISYICLCVCLFEVATIVELKSWKTTSSEGFFFFRVQYSLPQWKTPILVYPDTEIKPWWSISGWAIILEKPCTALLRKSDWNSVHLSPLAPLWSLYVDWALVNLKLTIELSYGSPVSCLVKIDLCFIMLQSRKSHKSKKKLFDHLSV